jgi:hypothetical protein
MDRPTLANEFLLAVTVAIADAFIRLAHDKSEYGAWAGRAGFTSDLLQRVSPDSLFQRLCLCPNLFLCSS